MDFCQQCMVTVHTNHLLLCNISTVDKVVGMMMYITSVVNSLFLNVVSGYVILFVFATIAQLHHIYYSHFSIS